MTHKCWNAGLTLLLCFASVSTALADDFQDWYGDFWRRISEISAQHLDFAPYSQGHRACTRNLYESAIKNGEDSERELNIIGQFCGCLIIQADQMVAAHDDHLDVDGATKDVNLIVSTVGTDVSPGVVMKRLSNRWLHYTIVLSSVTCRPSCSVDDNLQQQCEVHHRFVDDGED